MTESIARTQQEFVDAVLSVSNEEDACRFFDRYVAASRAVGASAPEAVIWDKIGFCFGEGMPVDRRRMWAEAIGACHPLFGPERQSDTGMIRRLAGVPSVIFEGY